MRLPASLAAIALLCMGAWAQTPAAATARSGQIGIINIQTAIRQCQEGKKAATDLNTQFQPKQAELQQQNQQIQALQKKLQDGGNTLSADAKAELGRSIESKQKDLQRAYEDANSDFQNARNDVINRIGTKMMKVIANYAQENGFAMILDVSSAQTPVLYAAKSVDITPAIIRLYDQQYPVAAAKPAAPAAKP